MSRLQGISLASLTGNSDNSHLHLLIRIVSVNKSGQPTLPVHEIWAGRDEDGELCYEAFDARSTYDVDQEDISIEEANKDLLDNAWLRSLKPSRNRKADTDLSYVTQVVRGGICIWEKTKKENGRICYVIDEQALATWLDGGAADPDIIDDEETWGEPDPVDVPLWYSDEEGDNEEANDEDANTDEHETNDHDAMSEDRNNSALYSDDPLSEDEGEDNCFECNSAYNPGHPQDVQEQGKPLSVTGDQAQIKADRLYKEASKRTGGHADASYIERKDDNMHGSGNSNATGGNNTWYGDKTRSEGFFGKYWKEGGM